MLPIDYRIGILTCWMLAVGCTSDRGWRTSDPQSVTREPSTTPSEFPPPTARGRVDDRFAEDASVVVPVQASMNAPPAPRKINMDAPPWSQASHLTAENVVLAVLERNPTLEQMRDAAQAAQARYPQVVSLDDPMLSVNTAPGSAWSNNVNYAARVEVTQKLPFFGKRELRGRIAQAEANAVGRDVDDVRLQLTQCAQNAFADYYLAQQGLKVNAENLTLLREFRKNAQTRYNNGQVTQQDVLQADVEIAKQEQLAIAFERAQKVSTAKINTLMHLPPDEPLPPPSDIVYSGEVGDARTLRERAIAARPDLKAIADRIASEEAALGLAYREYRPDVELLGAYDGFWQGDSRPLQWQIGARINLPVRLARREAAVLEARARVAQRRAEFNRLTDQVNFQVQEAYEQLRESEKVIALYQKKLLPTSEANIKQAQTEYVNNKIPFVSLVEAQRNLISFKYQYYEALAEASRRKSALERALGEPKP